MALKLNFSGIKCPQNGKFGLALCQISAGICAAVKSSTPVNSGSIPVDSCGFLFHNFHSCGFRSHSSRFQSNSGGIQQNWVIPA
jgi:hypothetical protein